jgi:hypothetical protein
MSSRCSAVRPVCCDLGQQSTQSVQSGELWPGATESCAHSVHSDASRAPGPQSSPQEAQLTALDCVRDSSGRGERWLVGPAARYRPGLWPRRHGAAPSPSGTSAMLRTGIADDREAPSVPDRFEDAPGEVACGWSTSYLRTRVAEAGEGVRGFSVVEATRRPPSRRSPRVVLVVGVDPWLLVGCRAAGTAGRVWPPVERRVASGRLVGDVHPVDCSVERERRPLVVVERDR